MRKGFDGVAVLVQEVLKRDPHNGHLFVFRGRRGGLLKGLWHEGQGMRLFAKRLERGRVIWPSPADGTVAVTPARLGYLLEGIDWLVPLRGLGPGVGSRMRHSESPRDRCLTTAVCCDSLLVMRVDDSLPDDVEILKRLLAARNAELARARAEVSSGEALIAHLRLTIEKMRRELYGSRSERKARLLDQMELELEELEAAAAEDELAAERAA